MIVFDMAGTTIDEDNIVYKTLQKSINDFGIVVELDSVLAIGAGKEKLKAIRDIVLEYGLPGDIEKVDLIFKDFKKNLSYAYESFDIKSMLNAENVLIELRNKNILVVLNTGYDKQTAQYILDKINWS